MMVNILISNKDDNMEMIKSTLFLSEEHQPEIIKC